MMTTFQPQVLDSEGVFVNMGQSHTVPRLAIEKCKELADYDPSTVVRIEVVETSIYKENEFDTLPKKYNGGLR